MEAVVAKRGEPQYFEERARDAYKQAKTAKDRTARSIYLKTAECYHDLARAIERREQIRANTETPGQKH